MFVDEVLDTFPHDLTFTGTDEGDYHIHAAATHCQADLLLTDDDPRDITTTENVHYDIICPDDFFRAGDKISATEDALSDHQRTDSVLVEEPEAPATR